MGIIMGGLSVKILNRIHMFKPQTLRDVIHFAWIKDDQLVRQKRFTRPAPPMRAPIAIFPIN